MAAILKEAEGDWRSRFDLSRGIRKYQETVFSSVAGGTVHGLLELPFVVPIEACITQTQLNAKGFFWNFRDLFSKRMLYRSMPATAAGLIPKCWIHYFFLVLWLNAIVPSGDIKKASVKENFACGLLTGFSEVWFLTPINFVKFRMHRPEYGYKNAMDCIATVARKEGMFAYWKGTGAVFCRNSVCMGTIMGMYRALDDTFPQVRYRALCMGAVAGMVGSFMSYPFEMLRASRVHNVTFRSMLAEGPRRLFAGYLPGACRIVGHSAALGIVIPWMKEFASPVKSAMEWWDRNVKKVPSPHPPSGMAPAVVPQPEQVAKK